MEEMRQRKNLAIPLTEFIKAIQRVRISIKTRKPPSCKSVLLMIVTGAFKTVVFPVLSSSSRALYAYLKASRVLCNPAEDASGRAQSSAY